MAVPLPPSVSCGRWNAKSVDRRTDVDGVCGRDAVDGLEERGRVGAQDADAAQPARAQVVREAAGAVGELRIRAAHGVAVGARVVHRRRLLRIAPVRSAWVRSEAGEGRIRTRSGGKGKETHVRFDGGGARQEGSGREGVAVEGVLVGGRGVGRGVGRRGDGQEVR